MAHVPRDPRFDATYALWCDPYRYLSRRARTLESDVFETRLALQPTLCLSGAEGARLFYDAARMSRREAAPAALQRTLFGEKGVQGLDGEAHRHRKRLFVSLMTHKRIDELAQASMDEWRRAAWRWQRQPESVDLYAAMQGSLARAVTRWAGVPLGDAEADRLTRDLVSLFDDAGSLGPRHLRSRRARRRSERWAGERIRALRAEEADSRGHAAGRIDDAPAALRIALHRDVAGELLPASIAAVELLNVLRPTVAVSVYVVFIAHALAREPRWANALRSGSSLDADCFVREVRRLYPFFPAAMARVREALEWKGFRLPAGRRVLLDLYGIDHDPRLWSEPDAFRPERFLERSVGSFDFVPQGGGSVEAGHRCPGEPIAVALMKRAIDFLVHEIGYRVPDQDLSLDFGRLPALPMSRMRIDRIRLH
ncbi:MAG: cytochrome P450 [Myxococcota bacterium]